MIYLILAALFLIVSHLLFNRHKDAQVSPDPVQMIKSVGLLLYNKGALILISSIFMQAYLRQNGMPFAELLYLVNVAFSVVIVALIIRLLFFPEVAAFAEDREKFDAALSSGKYPFAMRHYFFATGISFAVPTFAALAVF